MVWTNTKNCVVVIKCTLPIDHVRADHSVEQVDVLNILPNIAAPDVICLQVRHRHDYNVRIHFHHQRNQAGFPNVVRLDSWLCFGNLKNNVFWVTGHIVDYQIGTCQKLRNHSAVVSIVTALLRIED